MQVTYYTKRIRQAKSEYEIDKITDEAIDDVEITSEDFDAILLVAHEEGFDQ